MKKCHVCRVPQGVDLTASKALKRVSSDCLPMFRNPPSLLSCQNCGTLTTDTTLEWRRACKDIYAEYEAYRQSGGIEEKTFMTNGGSTTRSSAITSLLTVGGFDFKGKWLDFGCGNGSFLRLVLGKFEGVEGYGIEFGERNEERVSAIPGVKGFGTSIEDLNCDQFQTISMIHVLEHIENPLPLLKTLRMHLADGGQLLLV